MVKLQPVLKQILIRPDFQNATTLKPASENCLAKKLFLDLATKPIKHKQKNNSPHFLNRNIYRLEKKQVLVRFEPETFAVPGIFFAPG